jgi:hypothetical protein
VLELNGLGKLLSKRKSVGTAGATDTAPIDLFVTEFSVVFQFRKESPD